MNPRPVLLTVLAALLIACGDSTGSTPSPAEDPPENSRVPPPGDEEDDAPPPPPAPSACGNGALDGHELCDGDTAVCAELGALWEAGEAPCRPDCSGYDVSGCTRSAQLTETVRPAEREARWSDAQCNDGSSFVMYVSMPSIPSDTWVIYLEGGGRCDGTYGSCVGRPVGFVSSRNEQPDRAPVTTPRNNGTFFSRDPAVNPTFHDANHAYARYCSSDLWGGTNTIPRDVLWKSNSAPVPFVFTGHHNVVALVETLFQRYGLDDEHSKVLFTGSSAGSAGATRQINVIAERMPSAIASGRFAVLLGSAFRSGTFDDPNYPFQGGEVTPEAFFEAVDAIYLSDVDPRCQALASARGLGASACGPGPLAYETITSAPPLGWGIRAMVAMNRLDQNAMGDYRLPIVAACSPADLAAREAYFDDMTEAMRSIPWLYAPADPQETVADENLHGLIIDPLVWQFPISAYGGLSLRDAVTEMWLSTPGAGAGRRMLFDGDVPHASDAPF